MPSTLADWLSYLESLHPKTIALGLERVEQVRRKLNLQPAFPVIIVGGTNGKGSVCAMLESILHAAGYKVGCYTSPHLLEYNERVRIAKQQASDAELCASFAEIEQARGDISLTYFEFGTLAAMQCFISHQVDVAVLEVGLGGRLDAVNVFDADVAVVASVDIDHVDYLGDTREKIAFEKAGIFRQGRVAICADGDVPQALRQHAQAVAAELWCIGSEFGFQLPSPAGGGEGGGEAHVINVGQPLSLALSRSREREQKPMGQWNFYSKVGTRSSLPFPALRGAFQLHNASAVLAVLDALKDKLPVSMEAVRRGLVEVQLAGRFQFVPGLPQLILDVAHNPHAARSLAQNLAALPPAKTFAVFAMLKDKDMTGVVEALDGQIDVWLVAGITAPRGATAAELVQVLQDVQVRGEIQPCASIADAMHEASNRAGENDRIAAFGSFYTVAEVMRVRGLRYG
ncbi:bifunctional tetrahydrofolate synthase/dihydrofolate synthase [Sideroxydans lithotrophicus]|uniref:Dihydrofolate synthase/folylpolyglutamate synthase n=1 Tax=Sideroxydans lithotrophicus (strain ES-1) TaxID=580332 RepID=D5CU27_SIDLE|nr:bifunctional tetrahydrofolate synthase/dihydrofolate synthase [Sideroxydans lithotrophicus]ADE12339.1 FolC bifunctional protein [Sideroxydans lithotrophicus ES-1]